MGDTGAREYDEKKSALIEQCSKATSLALYYHDPSLTIEQIGLGILKLICLGNIQSFGIYSQTVVQGEPTYTGADGDLSRLLERILTTRQVASSLKRLDIALENLMSGPYSQVQALGTSLTSLTMRQCLSWIDGSLWDPFHRVNWSPSTQIQRLNLLSCTGALGFEIPDLVKHFKSLRYLLVSECGAVIDVGTEPRSHGWSHSSDALCNQRVPLEEFHIEYMHNIDILSMGVIPVNKLIITRVVKSTIIHAFQQDQEIFPALKYLSIQDEWSIYDDEDDEWRENPLLKQDIEEFCLQREIALSFDAKNIIDDVAIL
ncbi:hypothetical protein CPB86DRAFT_289469 [Serendipita vermifera]|nr:hypothetical protein CPB86DRAFT_289469 [Serendipita vermifera]